MLNFLISVKKKYDDFIFLQDLRIKYDTEFRQADEAEAAMVSDYINKLK